jgi:hypothetical protein
VEKRDDNASGRTLHLLRSGHLKSSAAFVAPRLSTTAAMRTSGSRCIPHTLSSFIAEAQIP